MNCAQAQRMLMSLIDNELTQAQTGPIEEHIRACASCRREYARIIETLSLAASWSPTTDELILKLTTTIASLEARLVRATPPQIMTEQDVMHYLNLDRGEFDALLPGLPRVEVAGRWLFRLPSIDAWLQSRELSTPGVCRQAGERGEATGVLLPQTSGQRSPRFVLL